MKIKLVKEDNKIIGYTITPETKEDKLTLGNVRNLHFFGFDDTYIRYNGMESENIDGERLVTKLKFVQEKHHPDYK